MTQEPTKPPSSPQALRHLLSFDVEEYFHAEAVARGGLRPEDWGRLECRAEPCVDRILAMLSEHGATATFFILGWVARNEPQIVRKIASAGHEIASHGMSHRMLGHLGPAEFAQELRDSRRVLEDLGGREVIGYRAPTFSITSQTAWALDVLAQEGFLYDSSVFPVRHDRYGVPDAPCRPHTAIGPGGGKIMELPPLTRRILGANMPIGGGGYLRLLPVGWVAGALAKADSAGVPGMIYLHPWELDPRQPVLPMNRLSRFRHRVHLARTESKLRRLLRRFAFTDVRSSLVPLRLLATQREHVYQPPQGD